MIIGGGYDGNNWYDQRQQVSGASMHYVGGTAYFNAMPGMPEEELEMVMPPNGVFNSVDCKWKEVLKVPTHGIHQVTKACWQQRYANRDGKNGKKSQNHPNVCEDFHAGVCMNGSQCKLFHIRRDWLENHRKPHQTSLETARQEFEAIQKEGKHFTVFCPNLKETLPVPANKMHFTRGLFLREEERARRQGSHGGKHHGSGDSHQNPSVCQLFIKGGGEKQCKWEELCNQAHPHKDWLKARHEQSVKYVQQCKLEFDLAPATQTWEALDPDTNERITIPKPALVFTRGLYAKEFVGSRLASVCMLFLKRYDGAQDGSGCTAGDLCNQIHVDLVWVLHHRINYRVATGDYDATRNRIDYYQGVHYPAARRRGQQQQQQANSQKRWGASPGSSPSLSSATCTVGPSGTTSPVTLPSNPSLTPDKTPPTTTLSNAWAVLNMKSENTPPPQPVAAKRIPNPPPAGQPFTLQKKSPGFGFDDLGTNSQTPPEVQEKNVIDWFSKELSSSPPSDVVSPLREKIPSPPPPPVEEGLKASSPPPESNEEDTNSDGPSTPVLSAVISPVATPMSAFLSLDAESDDAVCSKENSPIRRKKKEEDLDNNTDYMPFIGIESLTALMEDLKSEED
eukprot:TRINITY_DN21655_c0_g1_i1.p1 TRINITY_DN21655_c0_g1~~TRINITY_DN21655_c0_g1_i1.p1  ORF type:complete len:650 (+),score=162.09 TRINITY_DN21655_c0_g1_i1:86-1951(+)